MKFFSRLFLAGSFALTLLVGYGSAKADDMPAKSGANCSATGDHGQWNKKDRLENLKVKLGLTKDQEARLKEVFKSSMEANKPLMDQQKIDMDTLQQKVDLKASDADIKSLLDALKKDHQAIQDNQEGVMAKIQEILNPMQQAKMLLMRRHKPMFHQKGHMMHKKHMTHKHKKSESAAPTPSDSSDTSSAQ